MAGKARFTDRLIQLFEKFSIKFLGPALTVTTAISGFLLTVDFDELRQNWTEWHGILNILDSHRFFLIFVVSAVLGFFISLFLARTSPTRESLKRLLREERQKISGITDHVSFCLEGFIWEQAKRIGFEENGVSRISLYLHEPDKNRFFCLVRRSHNTKLEQKGRSFFRDDEGCIAKAWENDWHFDNSIPSDDGENAEYQKTVYGITKSTFSKLTMKPRLIAGKKVVDRDDRPIALIVVESLKADAFEESSLKAALVEASKDCATLLTVWKQHLPTSSAAQDEGL